LTGAPPRWGGYAGALTIPGAPVRTKIIDWRQIFLFAGHFFAATVVFSLFCIASLAAMLLVQHMASFFDFPPFALSVIALVENAVLIADALLYLLYVAITGWRLLKEIFT
jgi:hypothetical protein